jgi:hypothetical protein
MKVIWVFFLGVVAGYVIALASGRTIKQYITRQAILVDRSELNEISKGIDLFGRSEPGLIYHFEGRAGSVGLECPPEGECRLEVPSQASRLPVAAAAASLPALAPACAPAPALAQAPPPGVAPNAKPAAVSRISPAPTRASRVEPARPRVFSRIRRGDVILAVNGERVRSPTDAVAKIDRLARKRNLRDVRVRRAGHETLLFP